MSFQPASSETNLLGKLLAGRCSMAAQSTDSNGTAATSVLPGTRIYCLRYACPKQPPWRTGCLAKNCSSALSQTKALSRNVPAVQ